MIDVIFCSLLIGLLRSAHGQGYLKKGIALFFMVFFVSLILKINVVTSILLMALVFVPGWGSYFSAMGTVSYIEGNKEYPIASYVADLIYRNVSYRSDIIAGIVGMGLRWFIPAVVPFILIADSYTGILAALPLLLVGCIYAIYNYIHKYPFLTYKHQIVEFLSGMYLILLLGFII